jgi:hypothetical protein
MVGARVMGSPPEFQGYVNESENILGYRSFSDRS